MINVVFDQFSVCPVSYILYLTTRIKLYLMDTVVWNKQDNLHRGMFIKGSNDYFFWHIVTLLKLNYTLYLGVQCTLICLM